VFIGHFALGLSAKKLAPAVSLGALFAACQLADLIWPNLVLLGIERVEVAPGNTALTPLAFIHYPYSHSLLALAVWAAIFAVGYAVLERTGPVPAIVIAALVLSHWVLDVVSHTADMPITLGDSPRIGLGLWNHPAAAIGVEVALFAAGVWLYNASTRPLDRRGSVGFWALVVFLLAIYVANVLGPPPPSATAVAWSAQALWLVVLWGYWVDRHRSARRARARLA
jgi:membrane-bound metal-dependent hydrolase YbcI (DUF457 family)